MNALETAHDALARGDRPAALAALLAAWRAHRHPRIAQALDLVSADLDRALPGIDGDRDAFDLAWTAAARAGRDEDVPRLAAGLAHEPRGAVPDRVAHLTGRGADPRVATALMDLIDAPPITASSNFTMWRALFRWLADCNDVRLRPRLAARQARAPGGASQFWPLLHTLVDRLLAALRDPPPLGPADDARVTAILDRASALAARPLPPPPPPAPAPPPPVPPVPPVPAVLEALLRAVHDHPEDDAPRAAYAAALRAAGDPRGEFIELQLRYAEVAPPKAEAKRMQQLLKLHWRAWSGPLAALKPGFRRGFPDFIYLDGQKAAKVKGLAGLAGSRELGTVTCVETDADTIGFFLHPAMRAWTTVRVRSVAALAPLCEYAHPLAVAEIENLYEWGPEVTPAVRDRIRRASAAGLARLRELMVYASSDELAPAQFDWLLASPLARRLDRLRLDAGSAGAVNWHCVARAWWPALDALPGLRVLELGMNDGSTVALIREGGARRTEARLLYGVSDPSDRARWKRILEAAVDPGAVLSVAHLGDPRERASVVALADKLRGQHGADRVTGP